MKRRRRLARVSGAGTKLACTFFGFALRSETSQTLGSITVKG